MERGKRARGKEAKERRRESILGAAIELYRERGLEGFSMADLAQRVGLAKGTLYLYFRTKEEVFLELLEEELASWFDSIDGCLEEGISVDGFVDLIGVTLAERPEMVNLIGQLHNVLERNIGYERAFAFKQRLLERTLRTGRLLEGCFRFLGRGEGAKLLVRIHAMVIGFQHLSTPARVVEQVLEETGMEVFRVEFPKDLLVALRAMIKGMPVKREEKTWQVIL